MRKFLPAALALMLLAAPHATWTQATADAGQKNAQQARAALDAMVQALGGQAWLNMKNQMRAGTRGRLLPWQARTRHHRVLGVPRLARP